MFWKVYNIQVWMIKRMIIIISSMFSSIKSIFQRSRPASKLRLQICSISFSSMELIDLIRQRADSIYGQSSLFKESYLFKFLCKQNLVLIKSLQKHIQKVNALRCHYSQLAQLILYEGTDQDGFVILLLDLWQDFIENEISQVQDAKTLLRVEVYCISDLIVSVLDHLYPGVKEDNPQFKYAIPKRQTKLKIIQAITQNFGFKNVMKKFINKFGDSKGISGDFTTSQIKLTNSQLNDLIKFKEIPAPFNQSIAILLEFYHEQRIIEKVKLLVQTIDKVKEEISQYRNFYGMGSAVIGSDQIMPIVNFVCESTGKNIFASIQYIRVMLNGGMNVNLLEQQKLIKLIDSKADYCCDLVESMASVYCHSSKFGA